MSCRRTLVCFDSILVRLKDSFVRGWLKSLDGFDSILVRLKVAVSFLNRYLRKSRFDSILVRLKVLPLTAIIVFHNLFRFHTGSIKSSKLGNSGWSVSSFDSILVRLKDCSTHSLKPNSKFRFHTGSIKRLVVERVGVPLPCVSIPYWFD